MSNAHSETTPKTQTSSLTSSGNVKNVVTQTSLFFRLLFKFNDYAFAFADFLRILKYTATPNF